MPIIKPIKLDEGGVAHQNQDVVFATGGSYGDSLVSHAAIIARSNAGYGLFHTTGTSKESSVEARAALDQWLKELKEVLGSQITFTTMDPHNLSYLYQKGLEESCKKLGVSARFSSEGQVQISPRQPVGIDHSGIMVGGESLLRKIEQGPRQELFYEVEAAKPEGALEQGLRFIAEELVEQAEFSEPDPFAEQEPELPKEIKVDELEADLGQVLAIDNEVEIHQGPRLEGEEELYSSQKSSLVDAAALEEEKAGDLEDSLGQEVGLSEFHQGGDSAGLLGSAERLQKFAPEEEDDVFKSGWLAGDSFSLSLSSDELELQQTDGSELTEEFLESPESLQGDLATEWSGTFEPGRLDDNPFSLSSLSDEPEQCVTAEVSSECSEQLETLQEYVLEDVAVQEKSALVLMEDLLEEAILKEGAGLSAGEEPIIIKEGHFQPVSLELVEITDSCKLVSALSKLTQNTIAELEATVASASYFFSWNDPDSSKGSIKELKAFQMLLNAEGIDGSLNDKPIELIELAVGDYCANKVGCKDTQIISSFLKKVAKVLGNFRVAPCAGTSSVQDEDGGGWTRVGGISEVESAVDGWTNVDVVSSESEPAATGRAVMDEGDEFELVGQIPQSASLFQERHNAVDQQSSASNMSQSYPQ
ncbi:hypothetical protein AVI51_09840 [Piscirickettsia salmonis]|uniref:hypothetical protein n=1 Tax=Piscirickettsia salmonis TaxID=1238 RepID=UPI0002DE041A|nr:hypothetical protein [Piscirickettsia salmonis]ALA23636.1 flagellar hook-associated protein FlgK [Piscirickettsia salmonis]APS44077.1 hypothetical protein AVI48_06680 [Piscirickettsia salmonis]APS47438.1 hypothetical protein AVI49_07290 [Piscirickettsia salmonis]APS51126.1 hypothetical protein AVI50_09935 [Piscirickettsia salmonis]APS54335.1 hypothetical protein AVI51_09840 [Piscirickettsia salmonis]